MRLSVSSFDTFICCPKRAELSPDDTTASECRRTCVTCALVPHCPSTTACLFVKLAARSLRYARIVRQSTLTGPHQAPRRVNRSIARSSSSDFVSLFVGHDRRSNRRPRGRGRSQPEAQDTPWERDAHSATGPEPRQSSRAGPASRRGATSARQGYPFLDLCTAVLASTAGTSQGDSRVCRTQWLRMHGATLGMPLCARH